MKLALASVVLYVAVASVKVEAQSSKAGKADGGGGKAGKGNRDAEELDSGGIPTVSLACPGLRDPATAEATDDVNPRNIGKGSRMLEKGRAGVVEITVNTGQTSDPSTFVFPTEYRAISGANSGGEPLFGRAAQGLFHFTEGLSFADATVASEDSDDLPEILKWSTDGVTEKMSARKISNAFNQAVDEDLPNADSISDWIWQWGQFMDHDLTEVPMHGSDPIFDISIDVETDEFFTALAADSIGTATEMEAPTWLNLMRSEFEAGTQEPVNEISGVIDAGTVYGNTESRLAELMAADALGPDGTGRMATSVGPRGAALLPLNENGFCNGGGDDAEPPGEDLDFLFLAGDIRAQEQLNLAVVHTLWVREHNYWADIIRESDEDLSGEEVFEMTRVIIQAEIQHIHYTEFLPLFVGAQNVPAWEAFDPSVRPDSDNVASSCAYRGGHTFISNTFPRTNDSGEEDPIRLRDGFFNPQEIFDQELNPYLRGLATQTCQAADPLFVFDLRNLLLDGMDDLFARNVQRGRDHGVPTLNVIRESLDLEPHTSFDDFAEPFGEALATVYASVDDVECFPGMMSENLEKGSQFGDSQGRAIARQWLGVRDGDEFYYENILTGALLDQILDTTLAAVIERNADTPGSLTIPGSAFITNDVRDTLPLMSKEALAAKFGEPKVAVEIA